MAAGQAVVYVDASAPGGGTGSSANPFNTVLAAVNAAANNDTIFIRNGTYTEFNTELPNDRSLIFVGESYGNVILDANGSAANPNRRIFRHDIPSDGTPQNTRFHFYNLVFQGGYLEDEGLSSTQARGGAMWLRGDRDPGSSFDVLFDSCIVRNNQTAMPPTANTTSYGGAICFQGNGNQHTLRVRRSIFHDNTCFQEDNGGRGGAICIRNGAGEICYSTFFNNTASGNSPASPDPDNVDAGDLGADRVAGGAICGVDFFGGLSSNVSVDVSNCIFQDNEAVIPPASPSNPTGTKGGAIAFVDNGSNTQTFTINVSNCVTYLNQADNGPDFYQCSAAGNTTNTDPLFSDTAARDFSLTQCPPSPALDAGSGGGCSVGSLGAGPDIGAIEADPGAGGATTIDGPAAVCSGETAGFSSALSGDWTLLSQNGSVFNGGNTSTDTVKVDFGSLSAGATDTLTILTPAGCEDTLIISISPANTISGPAQVCAGSEAVFSATSADNWSLSSDVGSAITTAGASATITYTAGAPGMTAAEDTLYIGTGACQDSVFIAVEPSPSISGPATVCAGSAESYTVSPSGGSVSFYHNFAPDTSDWSFTAGSDLDVNWLDTTQQRQDTIFYTGPNGCQSALPVTNTARPNILGPDSICSGESVVYSSDVQSDWTFTGALGSIPGNATATNSITFDFDQLSGATPVDGELTATSADGCVGFSPMTLLPQPAIVLPDTQVCSGLSLSGLEPSAATWLIPAGGPSINSSIDTSAPVTFVAGNTSVGVEVPLRAVSAFGCGADTSLRVQPPPALMATSALLDTVCDGESATFSVSLGAGDSILSWTHDELGVIATDTTTVSVSREGDVIVRAASAFGCRDSLTAALEVLPSPEVEIGPINPEDRQGLAPLTLTFTSEGVNVTDVVWDFGDPSLNQPPATTDPSPTVTYQMPGEYSARLIGSFNEVCFDTTEVGVIAREANMFIPNVFTPNGDGLNDAFLPRLPDDAEDYQMHIYSRWGTQIFSTGNPNEAWEPADAPEGVYVYKIQVRLGDGPLTERSGTVTLIR